MGMFDSFYDEKKNEWQTKALACNLDVYRAGDEIPGAAPFDHQMMVLGGPFSKRYVDSFATIRNGRLASVPIERDENLPLLDYCGGWLTNPPVTR